MDYRSLLWQLGLDYEEHDHFGSWAFGENYKSLKIHDMWKQWNKLHENELKLSGNNIVIESTKKMLYLYKKKL